MEGAPEGWGQCTRLWGKRMDYDLLLMNHLTCVQEFGRQAAKLGAQLDALPQYASLAASVAPAAGATAATAATAAGATAAAPGKGGAVTLSSQ